MTSIVDEFLADFGEEGEEIETSTPVQAAPAAASSSTATPSALNEEDEEMPEVNLHMIESKEKFKQLAKLSRSEKLANHLKKITSFIESGHKPLSGSSLVDDVEYPYIVASNAIAADIDDEITIIHKFIRDLYEKKFPELEQHVMNPLDYARVVKKIGNETDLTSINMSDILPQTLIMVIKVTASTTAGQKLSEEEYEVVQEACDEILRLDEIKQKILGYVSSRMNVVAPNLSAILGTSITAQLIGAAGGLTALSKIPAANIQLLGRVKKNLIGMSSRTQIKHVGFIGSCDIINNTPPDLRKKASRLVSTKSTLAARVDSFHSSPHGGEGRRLREEIEEMIKKWQEPPPAKQEKPLPAPDDKPKKKRGGRKARKVKEIYKMTEVRKKYNRMAFGVAEDEHDQVSGKGMGMLGGEGSDSGSIRMRTETKPKKKNFPLPKPGAATAKTPFYGGSSVSGLASSLAFTPVQGIELENPMNALKRKQPEGSGKESVFANPQFVKVKKQKTNPST